MPAPGDALPGRDATMPVRGPHRVLGAPITPPFPDGAREALFGMGCFWGAERIFWRIPGVHTTAAGYAGGYTPNPTYEEVCSGRTGHNEVVRVVYDPARVSFGELVRAFFENHDPTQGMRQGNDVGTQYRSGIYVTGADQRAEAEAARDAFGRVLAAAGHGPITTEIADAGPFYYAEPYHQQYLDANPGGYCNHGPNGFSCPIGLGATGG
ncbi:MAG: peptide-methionine (S)-S-oxide reductase MsrA [Thermoleophilia bacterium]|nr:peptide-methionine (S)-S-oxide reductase MsrA [Thermoleophilia bacterium]